MKQYINESITGFPSFSDHSAFFNTIKMILIDGIGNYVPDSVNGQRMFFNNGLSIHEHTIYLISDGISSVKTKMNKIDLNTVEAIRDISALNHNNLTIKTCPIDDWQEVENEDGEKGLKGNISTVFFSKDFKSWGIMDADGVYTDPQTFGNIPRSNSFSIIFDKDSFFVKTWMNNSRLYNFFFLNNDVISAINDFYYSDYMRFSEIKVSGLINRRSKKASFTHSLMPRESYSNGSGRADITLISPVLINYAVLPMFCFSPKNIPQIQNNVDDDFFYANGALFCAIKTYSGNYASLLKIGDQNDY